MQHCWSTICTTVGPNMLRPFAWNHNNVGTVLLALVAYSLKPVKLLAQQVPTFLLFCDRRSLAQQYCAHLHGTTTMKCMSTSIGILRRIEGRITVPECISSLDDLQQCWQLMRSFACTIHHATSANNSHHCWGINVVTCCVRLHAWAFTQTFIRDFVKSSIDKDKLTCRHVCSATHQYDRS